MVGFGSFLGKLANLKGELGNTGMDHRTGANNELLKKIYMRSYNTEQLVSLGMYALVGFV